MGGVAESRFGGDGAVVVGVGGFAVTEGCYVVPGLA